MSHVETLAPNPERTQELRHWSMETQPDHPETAEELVEHVVERMRLWHGEGNEPAYDYIPTINVNLEDDGMVNAREAEIMAAHEWLEQYGPQDWWHQLNQFKEEFTDDIFGAKKPTEQFIVGQKGDETKGIRFYNFSKPMNEDRQDDLTKFVDLMTQYFGEHAYEILTDVVICDFADKNVVINADGERGTLIGHIIDSVDGVLFMNADYLRAEAFHASSDTGESSFLDTMVHEFAHHMNALAPQEAYDKFAKSVGWDIDAMRRDADNGVDVEKNMDAYRPPVNTASRWYAADSGGVPSEYGAVHPEEGAAEITKYAALDSVLLNHYMPETRDAWLEYIQSIHNRDIVVSLDREPIITERRTGSGILYPRTELPETIDLNIVTNHK